MVCDRCIYSVRHILDNLNMPYKNITLGEVTFEKLPSGKDLEKLDGQLKKIGFERIETRLHKTIEDIKKTVLEYVNSPEKKENLSSYITAQVPYDYSYLSDLFSSAEDKSIEQFFISQRIEKVKELMVYDQLSLTEIAFRLGFSSVHHLSAQFKKSTGLTPTHFKSVAAEKRKSIDKV